MICINRDFYVQMAIKIFDRSAIILNNVQFSIKSLSDDKTYAQCITYGWMTSKFYVLFNSFSVTSG